jgi:hypothetical protein
MQAIRQSGSGVSAVSQCSQPFSFCRLISMLHSKSGYDKSEISSASGDGQLTSHSALTSIIKQFPSEDLVHPFGYGLDVFLKNF